MAKKERNNYLSDQLGGGGVINRMESGLLHLADSQAGGIRGGRVDLTFGSPGAPLEKSAHVDANLLGRTPNLSDKFFKRGQK